MDFDMLRKIIPSSSIYFDYIVWDASIGYDQDSLSLPIYPEMIPKDHPITKNTVDYMDELSKSLAFKAWAQFTLGCDILDITPSITMKEEDDGNHTTNMMMVCSASTNTGEVYQGPISTSDNPVEYQYRMHFGKVASINALPAKEGIDPLSVVVLRMDCRAIPSVKRGDMFSRVEGEVLLESSSPKLYHMKAFDTVLEHLKNVILPTVSLRLKGFYKDQSYTHDQEINHWSFSFRIKEIFDKTKKYDKYCLLEFSAVRNITMDGIEFAPFVIRSGNDISSHDCLLWKFPYNKDAKIEEFMDDTYTYMTIANRINNASIPYSEKKWIMCGAPSTWKDQIRDNPLFDNYRCIFCNESGGSYIFFYGNYKEKSKAERNKEGSPYLYTKMCRVPFSRMKYYKEGVIGCNYYIPSDSVNKKEFDNFEMLSDFWLPSKDKPKEEIVFYLKKVQYELIKIQKAHPEWNMISIQGIELVDPHSVAITYGFHENIALVTDMILSGELEKFSVMWLSKPRSK